MATLRKDSELVEFFDKDGDGEVTITEVLLPLNVERSFGTMN